MNKKIKILIVEDHQSMIDGIQLLLKNEKTIEVVGYFNNGLDLINFINKSEEGKVDVILTDIKMPEMNGIEMTKKIKKEYPHIEILAFSMFAKERVVFEMLEAGVTGYLLKNAPLDVIIEAIQKVYEGVSFFDDALSEIIVKYKNEYRKQKVCS
jgi:two-component system nitrate/nitrite response regulator NarL